jgi:hypothetical protein
LADFHGKRQPFQQTLPTWKLAGAQGLEEPSPGPLDDYLMYYPEDLMVHQSKKWTSGRDPFPQLPESLIPFMSVCTSGKAVSGDCGTPNYPDLARKANRGAITP